MGQKHSGMAPSFPDDRRHSIAIAPVSWGMHSHHASTSSSVSANDQKVQPQPLQSTTPHGHRRLSISGFRHRSSSTTSEGRRAASSNATSTTAAQNANVRDDHQPMPPPPKPLSQRKAVLFDFYADMRYPEQVSVRRDEIVIFHEDCGDGWARISAYTDGLRRGVVPASYLGPIVDKSKGNVVKQTIDQRMQVLHDLAKARFDNFMLWFDETTKQGPKTFFNNYMLPFGMQIYTVLKNRESISNLVSQVGRQINFFITTWMISYLSQEELLKLNNEVDQEISVIRSEKVRRHSTM